MKYANFMLLEQNRGISSTIAMLIVAGVVIVGVSYWLLFTNNMDDETGDTMEREEVMMDDQGMEDEDAMTGDIMEEDATPPANGSGTENNQDENDPPDEPTASVGIYIDYSAQSLATAQAEGKKPVLFFWAAWCPYCKAANEEFNANLGNIPSDVVLLKINYDTESALKTKYGITYQHTFVQVDANGNQVTKWSGGGINELINNVN